ncbi:unnamed protein product [Rotaria sp. Silwood2]|nr:unnamed protein product [Rotaria sp. Silwood2]
MVCFVHDRHFVSQFHAAINKLRQTNEFTLLTLRQLPKRCCSCPDKRKNEVLQTTESLLTSMDLNQLRHICLQRDLKHYVETNVSSSPSKIVNYAVLPFPTLLDSQTEATISNQFIIRQRKQLSTLQKILHFDVQFVTSNTSKKLLSEVVQLKYELVAQCSNYLEAIQAINGLWTIISIEDQSHIDIVKHVLQRQWILFIKNTAIYSTSTSYNWQGNLTSKVAKNKSSSLGASKIKYQKMLTKQERQRSKHLQIVQSIPTRLEIWEESEDEDDAVIDSMSEEMTIINNQRFTFLFNRYENTNKCRRPRTHRRQHILALAMAA